MRPHPPVYYDVRAAVRFTVRAIRFTLLVAFTAAFLVGAPAAASIWTNGQGL